jgi:hypothetical protein
VPRLYAATERRRREARRAKAREVAARLATWSRTQEIRGFFGKRSGPEITLTLQILNPANPEDKPSATDATVIGVLDQFTLEGEFSRSYSVPGIWLQVLASIGSGGGARIGQLAFVGWD